MTVTLSPRAAAQKAVDHIRKLQVKHFDGGKWYYHEELDVVVLDPPPHAFFFAFHRPTLKFFRSNTRGGQRLCSTSLRTVVDPFRGWLVSAMKMVVPDGQDFLAFERGDQKVMERRAAALAKLKQSSSALPTVSPEPAPSPPPEPSIETAPLQENFMALLDITSKTKTVQIVETDRTLDIDRKQFVAILRAAGAASMKKNAKIRLLAEDGTELALGENGKLRVEWTESQETESTT